MLGYFGSVFAQVVVLPAVGVVDADAEDLFRRRERRQQLDLGERYVGTNARGGGFRLIERLGAKDFDERGVPAQPRAQVDDALADHHAEARPAVQFVARKPHQRTIILIYRTLLEAWHRYGTEWMYLIRSPLVPDGRGCGDHRPIQRLDRHAEEARSLPDRHAPLHHPSRARVAQCVQRHLVWSVKFQPSRLDHLVPDGARVG